MYYIELSPTHSRVCFFIVISFISQQLWRIYTSINVLVFPQSVFYRPVDVLSFHYYPFNYKISLRFCCKIYSGPLNKTRKWYKIHNITNCMGTTANFLTFPRKMLTASTAQEIRRWKSSYDYQSPLGSSWGGVKFRIKHAKPRFIKLSDRATWTLEMRR